MLQLEDGRNADDTMVRGTRTAKNTPDKRPDQLTQEHSTPVHEDVEVPDADTCVLPGVSVSDGTVGLTDASIAPLAEPAGTPVVTPGVSPGVSRSSQPTTPSPSTPSKSTHAKRAATSSPKARQHRKKVASPTSADALMELARISKEKLAAKESERKEAAQIRDERQSKLDQMHIDRDIELEKLRNARKAESEANALERLRFNHARVQAKVEKFPNQVRALEIFRSEVQENLTDQEEKIQAAVMLNVEEKAFLFIQLPEDMRWDWLKKEIKNK
ncbi:hypothetical protein DFH28DRAFT_936053 [Melampsora americana]|nr:hypothetical protein DFH28DRAFT_936053 [Melampsora americana]